MGKGKEEGRKERGWGGEEGEQEGRGGMYLVGPEHDVSDAVGKPLDGGSQESSGGPLRHLDNGSLVILVVMVIMLQNKVSHFPQRATPRHHDPTSQYSQTHPSPNPSPNPPHQIPEGGGNGGGIEVGKGTG